MVFTNRSHLTPGTCWWSLPTSKHWRAYHLPPKSLINWWHLGQRCRAFYKVSSLRYDMHGSLVLVAARVIDEAICLLIWCALDPCTWKCVCCLIQDSYLRQGSQHGTERRLLLFKLAPRLDFCRECYVSLVTFQRSKLWFGVCPKMATLTTRTSTLSTANFDRQVWPSTSVDSQLSSLISQSVTVHQLPQSPQGNWSWCNRAQTTDPDNEASPVTTVFNALVDEKYVPTGCSNPYPQRP